jgi:hypothetical protein
MAQVILAIDLGKAKRLFCWYRVEDQTHRLRTVASTPQAFGVARVVVEVDRVVVGVCDLAGWVADLCRTRGIEVQVANANGEGWRWRNVRNKCDKSDVLKLARLSASNELKTVAVPERATRHWRGLILYRHKLIERATAIKNSIHALLVGEGHAVTRTRLWAGRRGRSSRSRSCVSWPGRLRNARRSSCGRGTCGWNSRAWTTCWSRSGWRTRSWTSWGRRTRG